MAAVLDDAPRGLVLEDHGLSESTAVDEEQPAARSSAGPRLPGSDAKERMNRTLLLAAGTAALGGMLFGYDIGIISGALLQLKQDFGLDHLQQELVVSLMLVGAVAASLVGGVIVDRFGRRDAIIGNAVVFIVGAAILCWATDYSTLLAGRVVVGFAVSLSAISEVIYITEIAPPSRRGLLVSLNEMGITTGILLSYVVNVAFIDTKGGWRYMFGLSMLPAILQGAVMLSLPRSTRWLLMHGRKSEARLALAREKEMKAVAENLLQQDGSSFSSLLRDPLHRKCLLVGCSIVVLQQLTGQPNVLYYSATIFKSAGFDTDRKAALANLSLGVAKVAATAFAIAKVDNMGRRRLLLVGSSIMVASLVILGSITAAYPPIARNSTDPSQFESAAVKWTSMACLVLFVVAYAFSYGPVTWLLLGEIFPDALRGKAVALATIFNWTGNLVVSLTFLSLMESIGFSATWFMYAAAGVAALVFIAAFVPETKGRRLEHVQDLMRRSARENLRCGGTRYSSLGSFTYSAGGDGMVLADEGTLYSNNAEGEE